MSAGISLILNRVFSMDRYGLAREFELQKFEMQIMKCEDLYALQTLCVELFAQTKGSIISLRIDAEGHGQTASKTLATFWSALLSVTGTQVVQSVMP